MGIFVCSSSQRKVTSRAGFLLCSFIFLFWFHFCVFCFWFSVFIPEYVGFSFMDFAVLRSFLSLTVVCVHGCVYGHMDVCRYTCGYPYTHVYM